MPKVSLEQKRLEALRRQLQGKKAEPRIKETPSSTPKTGVFNFSQSNPVSPSASPVNSETTDTGYLRHDLTKILILSTLAITFQLCLYLASIKHILNFL